MIRERERERGQLNTMFALFMVTVVDVLPKQ